MDYRRFAVYNFTGAALWAIGVTLAGYFLGSIIPAEVLDRWLYIIIAVVIGLSVLPTAMHIYLRNREEVHARIRSGGRRGAAPSNPELATPEGPK
jgi:membrane-associated protein